MMKQFRVLCAVAALLTWGGVEAAAQARIATVDMVKVFKDYWKTKQSQLALDQTKADFKKEFDGMQAEHKKLVEQYQKLVAEANDQAVSSEERERRKKELEPRAKEVRESEDNLKQYFTRNDADLKMKSDRMREAVIKDIKTVVASRARSGGYSFVVDSAALSLTQTEVFVYANTDTDLTEAVIKELNAAAPAEFSK
jgi:Skp family chaperone for outer membrane proteins